MNVKLPGPSVTPHHNSHSTIPLDKQSVSPSHDAQLANPRTWDSRELLSGQTMVLIRHLGEIYRLQSTRQGKLILTK